MLVVQDICTCHILCLGSGVEPSSGRSQAINDSGKVFLPNISPEPQSSCHYLEPAATTHETQKLPKYKFVSSLYFPRGRAFQRVRSILSHCSLPVCQLPIYSSTTHLYNFTLMDFPALEKEFLLRVEGGADSIALHFHYIEQDWGLKFLVLADWYLRRVYCCCILWFICQPLFCP